MALKYNSITTLNEIRAENIQACDWENLLSGLGKTAPDDDPLPLLTIMEINGVNVAIWCLRVPSLERLSRHFQAWCAKQVLHIFEAKRPNDTRVRDQISMLRDDNATQEMRKVARAAAYSAALSSGFGCAHKAAWSSVRTSAYAAARDASWAYSTKFGTDGREYAMREHLKAQEKRLRLMINEVK